VINFLSISWIGTRWLVAWLLRPWCFAVAAISSERPGSGPWWGPCLGLLNLGTGARRGCSGDVAALLGAVFRRGGAAGSRRGDGLWRLLLVAVPLLADALNLAYCGADGRPAGVSRPNRLHIYAATCSRARLSHPSGVPGHLVATALIRWRRCCWVRVLVRLAAAVCWPGVWRSIARWRVPFSHGGHAGGSVMEMAREAGFLAELLLQVLRQSQDAPDALGHRPWSGERRPLPQQGHAFPGGRQRWNGWRDSG